MNIGVVISGVVLILILIGAASCIRIVSQTDVYIIERFGAYLTTWGVGIHLKMPIIDKVAKKVTVKERLIDFRPQPVITKDNVSVDIDSVVFYKIVDSKLYTYGIENPTLAIENLTATTLRNLIGEIDLDETLTSRDIINGKMTASLDAATDAWGIKVLRVELKNIIPPADIREAMEKQMRAERERRELILQAEGEKKAVVLRAEGEKNSRILQAEGEKASKILAAEAEKESRIRLAEGEAESIMKVQEAIAEGIKVINESKPSTQALTLKGYEALTEVANGQATKIIVPSNLQDITSLTTVAKETFVTQTKNDLTKVD